MLVQCELPSGVRFCLRANLVWRLKPRLPLQSLPPQAVFSRWRATSLANVRQDFVQSAQRPASAAKRDQLPLVQNLPQD